MKIVESVGICFTRGETKIRAASLSALTLEDARAISAKSSRVE